jgi:Arylsulfotransferase (ASST)
LKQAARIAVALAVALAASSPALAAPSRPKPPQPAISPAPGTPDASPQTQISIAGVRPRLIESVRVAGSQTGVHRGRLRDYSGGQGASFVPKEPFAQGERVSATVRIRGLAPRRLTFTIALSAPAWPVLDLPLTQPAKLQHFVTQPQLLPPVITTLKADPRLAGDIFLTPLPSPIVHPGAATELTINPVGPGGPMIVDGNGRLVWFHQLPAPDVAANLELERYRGRQVLTWWQGEVTTAAYGLGEGVIASTSYRTLATVHAGNGYEMDIHEFRLAPHGDALFTVYSPVLVHLPGTPGYAATPLLDAIVQEVDVRTGLVVWEWHALGHIPLADSYATPANSASYDAFHINAVQPLAGGRILISARDTSAIYELDRASDRIIWTLGGKASSFKLGPGARFHFQHDAELLSDGDISMFDDEAGPPAYAPSSRGLVLALDMRRRRATVVRQYRPATDTSAESEGSLQLAPGGNVFAGFGSQPEFDEFAAGGRLLFSGRLPIDDGSYRAFRYAWSATPTTRPAVVARAVGGAARVEVYVSWNGATAVKRWQVLAGARAGSLKVAASVRRTGFETAIVIAGAPAFVAVRALGADGRVLRTSKVVAVASGPYAIP